MDEWTTGLYDTGGDTAAGVDGSFSGTNVLQQLLDNGSAFARQWFTNSAANTNAARNAKTQITTAGISANASTQQILIIGGIAVVIVALMLFFRRR